MSACICTHSKHSKFNFEKTISEGPKHALIYAPRPTCCFRFQILLSLRSKADLSAKVFQVTARIFNPLWFVAALHLICLCLHVQRKQFSDHIPSHFLNTVDDLFVYQWNKSELQLDFTLELLWCLFATVSPSLLSKWRIHILKVSALFPLSF